MNTEQTPGEVAFIAYYIRMGGRTLDGKPIPEWRELSQLVRDAWEAAADAVIKKYT